MAADHPDRCGRQHGREAARAGGIKLAGVLTDGGRTVGDVTISTSAGRMPGYLSRPAGDGRWPGVVVLHDGFGIDEAVRTQADWLASAGYLALSVDLGFWGRPSACLLRMFRDLRAGQGQTFDQVDAARAWLARQPGCDGRLGVIGFCTTGGFALLMAAGHGFSVSSVNYGLVRKNAADALHGACPIVASFGPGTGSCRPRRSGSTGHSRRSG